MMTMGITIGSQNYWQARLFAEHRNSQRLTTAERASAQATKEARMTQKEKEAVL
ncbi:hypothetical protein X777_16572 [Ooceraea biroi]|uniref:Uncharacterized protein n=1 Tax=Ooceraea biroi TaxID=2015173 RepID=A0A026WUJ7_OOCBI|nr:hypothetical protein X777_16572 [Ooceraea biroi]